VTQEHKARVRRVNVDGRHCWAVANVIFDGRHWRHTVSVGSRDTRTGQHCRSSMLDIKNVARQCRPTMSVSVSSCVSRA